MLALKIEVDGQPFTIAGVADWALLSAHITANKGNPNAPAELLREDRINLRVGAVSQPDQESISHHCRWGTLDLRPGSSVLITIVETHEPAPPIKRYQLVREHQGEQFTEEEMREFRWDDYLARIKKLTGEHGD